MGSVSSLVNGGGLDGKHGRASDRRLKTGTNPRKKRGGCSLCGFTQGPSSASQTSKGLSHCQSGRSEDFFYIKVSHKPRPARHKGGSTEDYADVKKRVGESDARLQPKLLLKTSAEKSLIPSAAFTPAIAKTTSCRDAAGHRSLGRLLCPLEKARSPDKRHKQDTFSGTLSDSGRNSMSSLPTHSTSGSLSASTGPVSHNDGGSAPSNELGKAAPPSFPPWVNGNGANLDCSHGAGVNSGGPSSNAIEPSPRRETSGGIRSPLTTDESMIERLEQRLLERESELQELQGSFEEKEADTCHLLGERERHRAGEMEVLRQRCSTKLQQASQMAAKTQQALQLQVQQLQAEREGLREDVSRLTRERDLLELRLRSYEAQGAQLAPTLEETQWEVCQKTGEISLLKKQLRDCQADVSLRQSEIVGLRASQRENAAKVEMLEKQSKEQEHKLRSRTIEVEVCQNELQRKKNEADLLREKVGKLETDIQGMAHLTSAKELQHGVKPAAHEAQTRPSDSPAQGPEVSGGHVSTESLQGQVEGLKRQLGDEKEARRKLADGFEQERQTWNKEKGRVIKYQRQLQLNYLQVHRKNQDLERILKELSAELEGRTELGADVNYGAGLQTYDDVIATEI